MGDRKIVGLDYLKGIMASFIVMYHYTSWNDMDLLYPLDNLLSRLGIYAVTIFFILSGATLALSYAGKQADSALFKMFILKRVVRIVPLFYLATSGTIILMGIASNRPSFWELFTNYTLLFGWIDPDSYIATGAWFIGTQLVFYSIFPIMLWIMNKSFKWYIVFFIGTIIVTLIFSFYLLKETSTLAEQWSIYINPFNQLFFFAGGFLIGWLKKINRLVLNQKLLKFLLVVSIFLLTFLPTYEENQIYIVTGYYKIIFSLIIFIIFYCIIFSQFFQKNIITIFLEYIGNRSYSIYLLHPLVYPVTTVALRVVGLENVHLSIWFAFITTIIASTITHTVVEQKFSSMIINHYSNNKLSTS